MNQKLQQLLDSIQQSAHLSDEEKNGLAKNVKEADKELEITTFKLDRTEKVKRTTAILLEETISELEQKRKAVEAQNKELEIESSLERVRTVALSMSKPDDMLEVCKTISHQLELLDVKEIRNIQTAIFYKEKGTYMNHEFYTKHNKTFITETSYSNHEVHQAFANQMLKGNGQVFITHIKGEEVKDWIAYQKTTNVFIDDFLLIASSLNYYWFSLGSVALGISTYVPLKDEEMNLFRRFVKVFGLAYTRYLDIEKAEAQAREAKIEAALERMRASAMSMRRSEELITVCEAMYKELTLLGFTNIRNAQIAIKNDAKQSYLVCEYSDYNITIMQEAPYDSSPIVKELFTELEKSGDAFYQKEFKGSKFDDWRNWRKGIGASLDSRIDQAQSMCFYLYSIGTGHLGISTFNTITKEQVEILKRFKNVFELSYRRYIDVARAEAQAREAQIELALERVRARTMAMQKSDELSETVFILFQQFKQLGENPDQATIGIINEAEWVIEYWVTMYGNQTNRVYKFPIDEPNVTNRIFKAWKEQKKSLVIELSGKELYDFTTFRESMGGAAYNEKEKRRVINVAFFSKGIINVQSNESRSAESISLLERFANVFDQTYTRFLDLKKAEAQAREAQIEAALERVRSKTMAMHSTGDVGDTVATMFDEFVRLGIQTNRCGILIFSNEPAAEIWTAKSNPGGKANLIIGNLDMAVHPLLQRIHQAWKKKEGFYTYTMEGIDLRNYYQALNDLEYYPVKFDINALPSKEFHSDFHFSEGLVFIFTAEPIPNEVTKVISRFAAVFGQTYRRYLDLQKAEAQARESQIQLALERVRARTMAMQKSDELKYASTLLFQQAKALGVPAYSCGYNIWEKGEKEFTSWMSTQDGNDINGVPNIPLTEDDNFIRYVESKQKDETFFVLELRGERMQEHYRYLKTIPAFKGYFDYAISVGFDLPQTQIHHVANFAQGNLLFITLEPCPEFHDVFKRFAVVFEQTYTRFLDLQKAEAQARESQVQLALERARTQSMLMQHSKELDDTLRVFHEQVLLLGINSAFSFLWLPDEDKNRHIFWAAWAEDQIEDPLTKNNPAVFKSKAVDYPLDRNEPATAQCLIDWKSNEPVVSYHVPPARVESHFAAWQELIAGVEQLKPAHFSDGLYYVEAFIKYGCFGVMTKRDLSEDEKKILLRFAIEFEQTYTRFLDLQKAEEQARESKIEAALERIRSRTMSMQHSNELQDSALLMFQQVEALGVPILGCGFNIWDDDRNAATAWMGSVQGLAQPFKTDSAKDIYLPIYEAAQRGESLFVQEQGGEELKLHYDYLRTIPVFRDWYKVNSQIGFSLPIYQIMHCAYFAQGYLMFISYEQVPDAHDIFQRFAKVFEQTYTRFLDLQKAEAQAREAQIETALERVRSRSMAMQKSDELREVIQVVYDQFVQLNIHIEHTGFIMDYKAKDDMHIWLADKHAIPFKVTIPYFDSAHWKSFNEAKEKGMDFFANQLAFEEKNKFYQDLFKLIPGVPEETLEYYFSCPGLAISTVLLDNIGLYIENFSGIPYTDEENATLMRFGKVFQQTYTRFLDLQKAEEQAREAIKRTSVDRVRAEIASMRTTNDLERITPLIWSELTTLDVPFVRCGVFIMDDEQRRVHTFLSTPEGKAIATLHVPFEFDLPIIYNGVEHWRQKKIYKEHWDANEFTRSWTALSSLGETSGDSHQREHVPENLYLHMLPFLQGTLYVGNDAPLNEDELQLVQNLADAFATAYARYEDFNKLESAKQQIERTLVDLKQAQSQLIQSEKMASLGELTAGIAHEIQNPLNFVNNFSEVNQELLAELDEEIEKGHYEEVKIIAKDIIGNEEKISHHGRRADAIVKGMLQHSRTSSGQKEPIDINVLADEYLRLAYHGLRAKDKSFNATLNTDYDKTLERVSVIPQDIGRVILNLITNAFYAINEKAKQQTYGLPAGQAAYEPTISISTRKSGDKISISVKDNGNGISQKVVDKIFQPFFTTKPTGQGTGLGLSLSYDITKAHGGEIKVETREGEGSEFVISLPG